MTKLTKAMVETLAKIAEAGTSDMGSSGTRLALLHRGMVEIASPGYAYTGTDRRTYYKRPALRVTAKGAEALAAK